MTNQRKGTGVSSFTNIDAVVRAIEDLGATVQFDDSAPDHLRIEVMTRLGQEWLNIEKHIVATSQPHADSNEVKRRLIDFYERHRIELGF